MNDITPPKKPFSDIKPTQNPSGAVSHLHEDNKHEPLLLDEAKPHLLLEQPRKRRGLKLLWWCIGILVLVMLVAAIGVYVWYVSALQPVSGGNSNRTRVQIVQGSSPSNIGSLLEEKKLIRSQTAFDIYTRLSGTRTKLQAGVYNLSPSESTEAIVKHLVSGNTDQFSITFLPGATLAENKKVLIKAGYNEDEIDSALNKSYEHPLFISKPPNSDLEGYIYGETYSFPSNATVEQILLRTFDEFYKTLQKNNLLNGLGSKNLNLYEAITLASIIQREVPGAQDQKQVAQIFYTRLEMGMQLGSDVTAYYGADKIGVERSVAVDTPYNTRIHTGMPPGPIGTPGLTALAAVAAPAAGDFIYFLSGDDEVTYFARTDSEHEANIKNHCQVKCSIP